MKAYIFRCGSTLLWGATADNRGANLPTKNCTDWKYFGHIKIDLDGLLTDDLNVIIAEIEENEFWTGEGSKIKFSEWTEKI